METKARRVADTMSATGGQARDGLSASLSGLPRRLKAPQLEVKPGSLGKKILL